MARLSQVMTAWMPLLAKINRLALQADDSISRDEAVS